MTEETQASQNIQASEDSVAVGSVSVGGSIDGSLIIGSHNVVGFTSDQVSALITQISTTFQAKPFDGRCPYKGLEVFQEKDAELFFGREKLVEDLISRVKESRAIFITGSSGSGKSSLARAGLLPALKKSATFSGWLYATMKPGRDPFEALASAFSRLKDPSLGKYFRENAGQAGTLHECAESALTDDEDQRLVLFIDQFEELFTQLSRDKTEAFINLLEHATTIESGRVIALFSMRSDFIPNCQTYPRLNALLGQKYAFAPIGAMQNDELVSAIAQPALRVGLRIDPDLIAQIINDMEGEPGALPLMQFALKDLFDAQQEKGNIIALTLNDYMARGGIHKALERHADHTFTSFNVQEQEFARSIFGGLIEVGRGTQDTKRTAIFDELIPANAQRGDVESIIHKLADARLITTDEVGGKTTVTISHEKLISSWTWLKKLVDENREVIAVQNEIINDAKEWDENGRDDSFLYRGARLANAREKLESKKLALSGLGMEFVQAGNKAYADALEQEKKRADHLQKITNNAIARQLTSEAQSLYAARNSNQMISALLYIQSLKLSPNAIASSFLISHNRSAALISRMSHNDHVYSVAFSPDGKYVVSASKDKTARVWEVGTGKEIARMTHDQSVSTVIFSPDGKFIVSKEPGSDRVWEARTGKEIARMTLSEHSFSSVACSPDGKYIVSTNWASVQVWEAGTGREIAHMTHDQGNFVPSVAFSPDGKYVVSGSWDKTARVWGAGTGKEIARMSHDGNVTSVIFSPDGKYVVSGSEDKIARVWEAGTGKEIARMTHDQSVSTVIFSPDGKYVVSGSWDGTARVWEAGTGKEIARMRHDTVEAVTCSYAAFSPDGKYVVSGGDKTARVWDAASGVEVARMTHDDNVTSVAFSPDGKYVVSGSKDKTAHVWAAGTGNEIARRFVFGPNGKYVVVGDELNTAHAWDADTSKEIASMTHDNTVTSLAFSPDGKCVFSDSAAKTAYVWDADTGKEIANLTLDEEEEFVAFSPDGKYVFSRREFIYTPGMWTPRKRVDYTARLKETSTGKEISRLTFGDHVWSGAFSPDGKYVVVGCDDKTARVWKASTGNSIARVWKADIGKEISCMIHNDKVTFVAFSSDGKHVVSGSEDKTVRVWEAESGVEVARMLHNDKVTFVAFSSDRKHVVSGSEDKTVRVWEAESGVEVARMLHDGKVYSAAFSPNGKYVVSGSEDKTARVWEAESGVEVARMTHDREVHSVTFNPDGKYVVSNNRVWTWQTEILIANACATMPRNLTRAEWDQYIGDSLPYQAICENLPIEPEPTEAE